MIEGLKPETPGEHPTVNVRFDFDVNGMLHVSARDRGSGLEDKVSVQATQARLTPADIAEARQQLEAIFDSDEDEADGEKPVIDAETQALLSRAQVLLEGGSLEPEQAVELEELVQDIEAAESQDELDELAEELLDLLFDLE